MPSKEKEMIKLVEPSDYYYYVKVTAVTTILAAVGIIAYRKYIDQNKWQLYIW